MSKYTQADYDIMCARELLRSKNVKLVLAVRSILSRAARGEI